MKDLITVVVPCYNVEKYVEKCIDSIINQTYKNLEIILVEDCSTDNTYEIIKKYLKKDKRIKIVKNEKNSGLSFSRNVGIKESTGKYIGFIDSDDYINEDFYMNLMTAMKKEKAEVSICDMKVVFEDTKVEHNSPCFINEKFSLENVVNSGLAASACNKLFNKELLSKYLFEVGKVNEDIAVVIPALVNAKKIAYAKDAYYYYVQHNGSIQNSRFSDKRFDIFYGVKTTLERIKDAKNYEELKQDLVYNQLIALFLFVIPKEKDRKRRRNIIKKYGELSKEYEIRKNRNLINFIDNCGTRHRLYYKALLKLTCTGHYILANDLMSVYDILYSILKKPAINTHLTLDDVIESAKYQASLKNNKTTLSVVVPNYNYARFMYQRIYSILSQNYKIDELIILDDKSSDESKKVIDEIESKIKDYVNIRTVYNKDNSGSAFKQWRKGFELAKSDYVWIAEADDYCEKNLIKKLMTPINKNQDIRISYSDTAFTDADGNIMLKTIKPEIDILKTGHWDSSYVNDGLDEIKNYTYLNNTIANVSSCIIKRDDYSEIFEEIGKYKQAGDWVFYLDVISRGKVAYIDKPLNYYRIHGNNVTSTTKKQKHFDELVQIHKLIEKKYGLDKEQKKQIDKRYKFLRKVWKLDEIAKEENKNDK